MAAIIKPASNVAPMSVGEIVKQANNFEYNVHIPLRYWLRSADTIQKEVRMMQSQFSLTIALTDSIRHKYTSGKAMTNRPTYYFSDMHSSFWTSLPNIQKPKILRLVPHY